MTDRWWAVTETYRQTGEVVAQHGTQCRRCSDVDLGELRGSHLALGAFAEVDSIKRQRQSPQAATLRQLPYRERERMKTVSLPLSL